MLNKFGSGFGFERVIDLCEERKPDPGLMLSLTNSLPANMRLVFEPQLTRKLSGGVKAMERVEMRERNRVRERKLVFMIFVGILVEIFFFFFLLRELN
ncbi:hypothetical protein Hanom_Chr02g00153121 [Helianthus anomalus]